MIKERHSADSPTTPIISKGLLIMKWTEAFRDHLHRCIGVRIIYLAYVIRNDENVGAVVPPLKRDQPSYENHGSVDEILIHRAS